MKLRPFQAKAIEEIRAEYAKRLRAVLFVLSTGGGKTFTFCHVAENAAAKGNRVCIIVHRKRLLKQASRALESMGLRHGIIAGGFSENREQIQVASIQTLIGRVRKDPDRYKFDLLIPDEAHHSTSPTFMELFALMPSARILGVTATPARTDGQGLGRHVGGIFDAMVEGPTMRELIAMDYLVQPVCYGPTSVDMSGVKTVAGDYDQKEAEKRENVPAITGSAVEHYRKHVNGQPAVAFCATVKHAQDVASDFCAAGIRAKAIDGSMEGDEIDAIIRELETGMIQVLTSCDVVSEGFDLPAISAAFLLHKTKSIIKFLQWVGRALRPSPGKTEALIFDHVGNCEIHGLPEEDREWSLDGDKKKQAASSKSQSAPPVRRCETCYHQFSPSISHCPRCGTFYEVKARKIEQRDGELERLDAEKLAEIRKKKALLVEIATATSLDQLMQIQQRHGYKNGWAYQKWHKTKRYHQKNEAA